MSVQIFIVEGPIPPAEAWMCDGAGAILRFEGVVRPTEDGRPIAALTYEAYEPMATRELRRLAERLLREFGVMAIRVEHSRGEVVAGTCSFRLSIVSRHRKEGIAAMDAFIDAMKRDVPIWKSPVFVDVGGVVK